MSLHDIWRGDVMPLSGVAVAIGRNSFDPPAPTVPVFDIHARSMVLHDSGSPTFSGILQFNSAKNHLQLIPSNSGAQPIVTAVYFDAYDAAGGGTITSSASTINLDTERSNSHPEVFVLASDELQINMSGVYEFEYRATADNSTTTRSTASWYLERQAPGGSFAEIPASRSYSYHRTTANGEETAQGLLILTAVGAGDKFRLRGEVTAGAASLSTVAEATALTVRRLSG